MCAHVMVPLFLRGALCFAGAGKGDYNIKHRHTLPDVVWPAAAKRQPRARSARRGYCRPTGAAVFSIIFFECENGPQR